MGGYLDERSVLDFATLQKRFLERQPDLVEQVDHVFVDELQDTNPIQYAIHLGWVRHGGVRLTGVGDDDHALYRWRGSDISCFTNLEGDCQREGIAYRQEVLEENHRSTGTIVRFAQAFRDATVLRKESLEKVVRAPRGTPDGLPVRLLEGNWSDVCGRVAEEVAATGAGRLRGVGEPAAPTVAVLMASTKEAESRYGTTPALDLRQTLEARGLRVYNPRNKAAAQPGSPVHDLLALISYLIDPVTTALMGRNGRAIEVWASAPDSDKAAHAATTPPGFRISPAHASIQKRFIKRSGTIDAPGPGVAPLLGYLDEIRGRLLSTNQRGQPVRLTLGGLVARILRMEPFRSSGYTVALFRQALFTQLLEANVAATRQTARALDYPIRLVTAPDGRIVWEQAYWQLLNIFGQLVAAGGLDDLEVEAFSEHAISILTFHQAKGLEFDHVYVARTGKDPDPAAALATELFSGQEANYRVVDGRPATRSTAINRLARADREREVYVAITRARETLTVLHAPGDDRWAMELNEGLADLLDSKRRKRIGAVTVKGWKR